MLGKTTQLKFYIISANKFIGRYFSIIKSFIRLLFLAYIWYNIMYMKYILHFRKGVSFERFIRSFRDRIDCD